ncbi:MAG: lambda-exonuclease family protein [Persicimonas sp.]
MQTYTLKELAQLLGIAQARVVKFWRAEKEVDGHIVHMDEVDGERTWYLVPAEDYDGEKEVSKADPLQEAKDHIKGGGDWRDARDGLTEDQLDQLIDWMADNDVDMSHEESFAAPEITVEWLTSVDGLGKTSSEKIVAMCKEEGIATFDELNAWAADQSKGLQALPGVGSGNGPGLRELLDGELADQSETDGADQRNVLFALIKSRLPVDDDLERAIEIAEERVAEGVHDEALAGGVDRNSIAKQAAEYCKAQAVKERFEHTFDIKCPHCGDLFDSAPVGAHDSAEAKCETAADNKDTGNCGERFWIEARADGYETYKTKPDPKPKQGPTCATCEQTITGEAVSRETLEDGDRWVRYYHPECAPREKADANDTGITITDQTDVTEEVSELVPDGGKRELRPHCLACGTEDDIREIEPVGDHEIDFGCSECFPVDGGKPVVFRENVKHAQEAFIESDEESLNILIDNMSDTEHEAFREWASDEVKGATEKKQPDPITVDCYVCGKTISEWSEITAGTKGQRAVCIGNCAEQAEQPDPITIDAKPKQAARQPKPNPFGLPPKKNSKPKPATKPNRKQALVPRDERPHPALTDCRSVGRADHDTDEWHALRAQGIGSSDAGALLGVSPHATAYDVWATKLGRKTDSKPWLEEYADFGQWMEPYIREWCEATHGIEIIDGAELGTLQYAGWPRAQANIDGLDVTGGVIEEYKTTTEKWEEIPLAYEAQCQEQMLVTGAREVRLRQFVCPISRDLVPSLRDEMRKLDPSSADQTLADWLLERGEVVTWIVERNERYIERMLARFKRFWDFVDMEVEPTEADPEGTVDLTDEPEVYASCVEYARTKQAFEARVQSFLDEEGVEVSSRGSAGGTAKKTLKEKKRRVRKAIEKAVALQCDGDERPKRVSIGDHTATYKSNGHGGFYWRIYTGENDVVDF